MLLLLALGAYSKGGFGVAGTGGGGKGELWLGGHKQGVEKCFKRVMADSRCAKDYFTYVARGDGNCGCKTSKDPLTLIRGDNDADYYRINPTTTVATTKAPGAPTITVATIKAPGAPNLNPNPCAITDPNPAPKPNP